MKKINVGVIGLGYWGPNYVRNFLRQMEVDHLWACDTSDSALEKTQNLYPQVSSTNDYRQLLKNGSIDCIAVATPPNTHYKITKAALSSGKHVLVAKPLTTKSQHAVDLLKIAKKNNLFLSCDLTFLYTSAVNIIKKNLENKVIGEPLYYDSIRTNLGLIQHDVNVIWDLAIHDFSILSYLFINYKPKRIFAIASKHFKNSGKEEIAHITIEYNKNFIVHIHVSWLSPVKMRTIIIGGTNKMILFDDIQPDEKIKIYDKGVDIPSPSITTFKPIYRSGDVFIPKVENEEALFIEIKEFINNIKKGKHIYDNAEKSLDIIRLLEACDKSLKQNKIINL
ncbi:hypothetical protein A3D01_04945 [Candidatus Woesebacteria bacterium RIFCSPHIGHO2_02_FULL_39_13]|uniref:Oxidoreductase n=1 Tax=Candidatus Woesebacteria bacterium RIFCSPHIGHO2_02_FULL_39_13 TaxID=1802505 RepID=A0A1F7Z0C0_9BACT|nr:MAG: hypothetical protein A2692_00265 [Candidatus Woesebacteria bacterium RIFCSPHIGHO2_01_FULL_39_95]OGM32894.1 MAG: hypothetical protein A3D01_04945 [Candidatus Woesebacteria bacterium RIFCSPHIGHO2_02_FULL_39_13]OGM74407.1 MAG: hypothetical protein A3H19_05255 [Candidatus Woesebacteria bacterium RIFCSPLOWO2_12_FULL_39_9]